MLLLTLSCRFFAYIGALAKSARAAGLNANIAEKYAAETVHVLEGKTMYASVAK